MRTWLVCARCGLARVLESLDLMLACPQCGDRQNVEAIELPPVIARPAAAPRRAT